MASSSKQFSTSHIIDPSRQTSANEYSLFDFSNEEPGIGACETHIDSGPSPAFEGWIATPEKALKQRRFIHTPLENADEQFRLLLLLPHNGYPSSVLQCALVHTPKEDPPDFLYISNSTYGNPFVLATILVNGLPFRIPRALDFLLRRLRDVEHGRLLFAFPICETPVPREADSDVAKALRLCESELFLRPNATEIIDMVTEIESVDAEELSTQCLAIDYEVLYIPLPDGRQLSPVYVPFLVEFWEGHEDSIYTPLDLLAEEIRVLIIEPHKGESLSEVKCRLRHAPLKGITSFSALSYTWGSTENLVPISLDGSRMDVTPNLHSALLQLRKEDDPVVFWIDALCINQGDIKERNRQVQRMAEIYQKAAEVVIWLGDSDHDSDVALGLMRKQFEYAQSRYSSLGLGNAASVIQKIIHHQYTDSQNQDELVASTQQELADIMASSEMLSKIKDEDSFLSDPMDLLAVYRFLNRPWFRRTWIVQEVVNARYVLVRCGDRTVEWVMIVGFAQRIASSSYLVKLMLDQIKSEEVKQYAPWEVQFERTGILTKMRHAKGKNFDFKLLPLMTLNRFSLATDPRDKIYGFLGMAADGKELVPRPDYSISAHELFIDLTKAMVKKYGSLDVICSSQPPLKGGLGDLPFWVPDWTQNWVVNSMVSSNTISSGNPFEQLDSLTQTKPFYCASGSTLPISAFRGHHLFAVGISFDTIDFVGSICNSNPPSPMEDWLLHLFSSKSYNELDSLSDAFCRLTCANRNPSGGPAPNDIEFLTRIYKRPNEKEKGPAHADKYEGKIEWQNHVGRVLCQRRFVITKKGRLGLVHPTVEKGDEIAILFGCTVPVVLYRHGNLRGFKGDAYIQDCMSGEVLQSAAEKDGGYSRIKSKGREWQERWFNGLENEPAADRQVGNESAPQVFQIL